VRFVVIYGDFRYSEVFLVCLSVLWLLSVVGVSGIWLFFGFFLMFGVGIIQVLGVFPVCGLRLVSVACGILGAF